MIIPSIRIPIGKTLYISIGTTGIRVGVRNKTFNSSVKVASFQNKKSK